MWKYIGIFLLSSVISWIFTPAAKRIAFKLGAIDVPRDKRRVHKRPIPRMGGLSIYVSFLTCSLVFSRFDKTVIGIMLGGTLILIMGILDDIKSLKPFQKLLFQIGAAIILILFNIKVENITVPFFAKGGTIDIGYVGILVTILWVVGITNAINLIDGLDGLACGIGLISSLTLFGVALMSSRDMAVLLTVILSGACIGFLPYNFNPASIFMGDTGSQFLGFILAAISIQGALKSAAALAAAVPILALGLPIYDTLFSMVRRKINNRPIMEADRGHLHHRLMDMGFSQKQVVIIMYCLSGILGLTSLLAMRLSNKKSYLLLIVICAIVLSVAIEFGVFNRKSADKNRGDINE